ATANHEGDSCDDVAVVYDRGSQGFTVIKYRLDAPFGTPVLLGSARIDLPWPVRRIHQLDFDGNGSGDLVAELPGLGVAVVGDDGSPLLRPLAFVPATTVDDLRTGRFGPSDAFVMARPTGALTVWLDAAQVRSHWLPAPAGTTTAQAALLPRGANVEIVAVAADGLTLRRQDLIRGQTPAPSTDVVVVNPSAYVGPFTPCGLGTADVDGDGDIDLVLQHPDGEQWYTVRHEHDTARPYLFDISQDLSLVPLGWYEATYTISVPASWDLMALPAIELQVMVEHPFTLEQRRWDRRIETIDPVSRTATFVVQWQEHATVWATILDALTPQALLPYAFVIAGDATAGRRSQLNFMGIGAGNPYFSGAERRTEPLVLHTDPNGGGNKSAQGIVWERRTAPPLPKADLALLPWQ
ncbi:MAG: hypothetical protein KDC98_02830, partial [Planctomycetes bacterium]|nr:hypothetical protein [Planctomycetota bacterium]